MCSIADVLDEPNQFVSVVPLDEMTSTQLSKATSHGPSLLRLRLQGGENSSSTNDGGNTKWNTVL